MIYKHHVLFDEVTYDIEALTNLYHRMKHCSLEWNTWRTTIATRESMIHEHQELVDGFPGRLLAIYSPMYEGKEMIDYPEIQDFVSNFNFLEPLGIADISFQINEPGFQFKKHIDLGLDYTMMCPLIPSKNFNDLIFWRGTKIDEENMTYDEVRDSNLEKEYHLKYNHKNPIIFNGKIVHSVDNVIEQERVVLRIKITHESYHDMITRHKANKFVINHKEVIAL